MNMDWLLIKEYLFGTLKMEFVLVFYMFAFFGMALTLLLHLRDSKTRTKKRGKKFKFNLLFWIKDNGIRVITNLAFIFVLLRFYDALHLSYKLDMFLGFAVGFSIDALIIFIREKTSLNVFQSVKSASKEDEDL